ncbi:MAG: methyltransferase domain-containing protein [Candidatus Aenigmarchaeota archaeon]|nr:methyltransferase domain-containing protein [Candidatus Aenigmarchaeota archaeon]
MDVEKQQRKVWETIADSWSTLFNRPEKIVVEMAKEIKKGKVLDVGCGNGRNLIPFAEKNLTCVGLDFSRSMVREAKRMFRKKGLKGFFVVGEASSLPFKDKKFSLVVFVRSLHNIPTRKNRVMALKECKRVGKKLILSVWKKWQPRFFKKLLLNFLRSDVYVTWKYHGKPILRFYHLYTKKELKEDLMKAGYMKFKIFEDGKGNIWVVS